QANGSWREEANISHKSSVSSATFSADGCHVITTSVDGTAKIYGQEADGSWLEKATTRHERLITLAEFSPDSRYVMTLGVDCIARITELRKDDDDRMSVNQRLREAGCLLF
ncbi:hypothetical protein, partial [Endozoicomonas sp. ALB122]